MASIIGAVTRYEGSEHEFMRGLKVRVVAVMKGNAVAGRDAEEDYPYLRDEAEVTRHGGITENDRVEVQPCIEEEQRFSFVTSDARAIDLVGLLPATVH